MASYHRHGVGYEVAQTAGVKFKDAHGTSQVHQLVFCLHFRVATHTKAVDTRGDMFPAAGLHAAKIREKEI